MAVSYQRPDPVFMQPPTDARLWRYVSLAKFTSMLEKRALHFARTDKLNDPFEGSWTKNRAPLVLVNGDGTLATPQPSEEELAKLLSHETPELLAAYWKNGRESTAVSCWYMGEHESAAMWLLYAAEGIAIETTFARFVAALPECRPGEATDSIQLGLVKYVDYEKAIMPSGNSFWRFIHKRLSFAHEQEFRAVIQRFGANMINHGAFSMRDAGVPPEGFLVPIDLERLVHAVHVAPNSPGWFADTVKAVVRNFGCRFPVQQSQLDATPFH